MRRTAYLLLVMMVLLGFSGESIIDSTSAMPSLSIEAKQTFIENFYKNRELERQFAYEQHLYDSLMAKPSLKWLLTGFTDAQIHHESRGNQDAVSPKGAQGIAQFMPDTWNSLKAKKLIPEWFDITSERHQRIAQLVYLDHLYSIWYKEEERRALTIASYNAGPGKIKDIVNKYGSMWREYLPAETINYLNNLRRFI